MIVKRVALELNVWWFDFLLFEYKIPHVDVRGVEGFGRRLAALPTEILPLRTVCYVAIQGAKPHGRRDRS